MFNFRPYPLISQLLHIYLSGNPQLDLVLEKNIVCDDGALKLFQVGKVCCVCVLMDRGTHKTRGLYVEWAEHVRGTGGGWGGMGCVVGWGVVGLV